MTFPNTRMALARLFANLMILSLPRTERHCLSQAFDLADLLKARAQTIKIKGQYWKVDE
jgi:hypothetical protein